MMAYVFKNINMQPVADKIIEYDTFDRKKVRASMNEVFKEIKGMFDWSDPEQVAFREEHETYSQTIPRNHTSDIYEWH